MRVKARQFVGKRGRGVLPIGPFTDKCTNGVCTPFPCNPVQNPRTATKRSVPVLELLESGLIRRTNLRSFRRFSGKRPLSPCDHDGQEGPNATVPGHQEGQAARSITTGTTGTSWGTTGRKGPPKRSGDKRSCHPGTGRRGMHCIRRRGRRGMHCIRRRGRTPGSLAPGGPLRPVRAPGGAPGVRTGRRGRNGQERQRSPG